MLVYENLLFIFTIVYRMMATLSRVGYVALLGLQEWFNKFLNFLSSPIEAFFFFFTDVSKHRSEVTLNYSVIKSTGLCHLDISSAFVSQ